MNMRQDDYAELLSTVLDNLSGNGEWLIGVDGIAGAGKTWIASRLVADLMDARLVDLEDHSNKHAGSFVNAIRYQDLRGALTGQVGQNRVTVVAGVCLLQVLGRLGITPDLLIYVMNVSPAGRKSDDYLFDDRITEAEALQEVRSLTEDSRAVAGATSNETVPFLDEELVRYHKRMHPHRRADIVFQRTAD